MNNSFERLWVGLWAASLVIVGGNSSAGNLSLAESPLFLRAAVDPNVFFVLDDSGSMDFEILVQGERDTGRGCIGDVCYSNFFGDGVAYLYENSVNKYGNSGRHRVTNDDDLDANKTLWRFKNAAYNVLYYNPAVTYVPWQGADRNDDPLFKENIDFTKAWVDPADTASSPATRDLTSTSDYGYHIAKYYRWDDSIGTKPGVPETGEQTKVEIKPVNEPFTGDGRDARDDCRNGSCSYAQEMQNFANWFSYYRKRSYVAWAAMGSVVANRTSLRTGVYRFNQKDFTHGPSSKHVFDLENLTDKEEFLNEIYCETDASRKCQQAAGTPARQAVESLGKLFKGDISGLSSPILPAGSGGECQQNFNVTITDGYWNGNPPSVGNADANSSNPYDGGLYADRHNDVSNTLADVAMYYYKHDLNTSLDNDVPTIEGVDENDAQHLVTYTVAFGVSGTLDPSVKPTDAGFAKWPTPVKNEDTTVDDLWHAAFNGRGEFLNAKDPTELSESLDDTLESIASRTASSSSVALSSGFLNSGSLLFQARFDSSDWSGQLLAYTIDSTSGNEGQISTKPVWDAGCMLTGGNKCPTDTQRADAAYVGQAWDSGREILTFKPSTGKGIPFAWPSTPSSPGANELDVAHTTWLRANEDYVTKLIAGTIDASLLETESTGKDRLEFLRGRNVSGMRERSSILGDIINSNPVYVSAPAFAYPDSLESKPYSGFVTSSAITNRKAMLYVGANDGMLHAFDATNTANGGTEEFAYIPSEVYENLWELTTDDYGSAPNHRAFVDASPTAGDVFINSDWATVLVGGLGRGGQGYFALDITNPANFDESKATSLVLWEFTDADDADLGFTYGQPAIVRMANGKWAAVFGNGYNNTAARSGTDTHVSLSGNAVLFVVDIETGSLIKKFDTGIGTADDPTTAIASQQRPNGIRTPSPVDLNGDAIVDYIYAPDLFGNVWKLDVRNASPNNWKFAYEVGGSATASDTAKTPFFAARNGAGDYLPITSQVEVGLHPSFPGQMLYFGTGKYIEDSDNTPTGQDTQVFFGVWDRNQELSGSLTTILRGHLEPQSIKEELPFSGSGEDNVRRTSSQTFAWHDNLATSPAQNLSATTQNSDPGRLGWFMDLYSTENGNTNNFGERMVADPVLRDGKIIFVTLLPLDDPCDFGGDSWLMELSAATGSRLDVTPFDLNADGVFDVNDEISMAGGGTEPVGGVKSGVGIMPSPGILKDNSYSKDGVGREFKYFSGSSGSIQTITESRSSGVVGRQSWRQVFDN